MSDQKLMTAADYEAAISNLQKQYKDGVSKLQEEYSLAQEKKREEQRIRERNRRFEKLPPEKKRASIARDVIAQLKVGKLRASEGTYLSVGSDLNRQVRDMSEDNRVCDVLALAETCKVCGIGAAFVAATKRLPGLKLRDLVEKSNEYDAHLALSDASAMRSVLGEFFTEQQIRLIEAAFERDESFANRYHGVTRNQSAAAVEFGSNYGSQHERLIAIMQNIIDNDGTFTP